MTDRARELRNNPTPAERALWRPLSAHRPGFTRQLPVDERYIIDLAHRTAMLAVEFDGSQHADQQPYDNQRTAYLESQGWRVIRLWNSDVVSNPAGAAEYVLSVAAESLGGTHPQPLPCREGRPRKSRRSD